MRKQILRVVLVLLLGVIPAVLAWPSPKAMAANPATINFQGRITNPDGTNETSCTSNCTFVFRLYDQSSPTTTGTCASNTHCWWEETDTLSVTNGIFQVQLGATCAFSGACNSGHSGINWSTNNALYLTLQFNGDSAGFMTPAIPLSSVPYAYNADSLGGIGAAGFIQNSTNPQSSSNFNISGTGVAATFQAGVLQSGSGSLTIDAAGGTILIGSNTTALQKSATLFTLDIDSASAATLSVKNNGGGSITLNVAGDITSSGNVTAGSGSVFKVGTTSGVAESACGANQYSQNPVATGGIITTAGGCAYAVNGVGAFSGSSISNGASITNNQITFGPADATNPGMVTASGTQTFGGTSKIFTGSVTVQSASGITIGTASNQGVLSLYSGSNYGTIEFASGATNTIILPASNGSANQCLMNGATPGSLVWGVCGGGVSSISVTLSPEYPGATLTHNNNSANGGVGTMTSDFCSGSSHLGIPASGNPCGPAQDYNYYSWTANATNDYDIWTDWNVPSDYGSIGSITFYGWTTSASDAVTLTVYDNGSACGNGTISSASTSFTGTTVSTSGCTISSGDNLIFDVDLKVGVNSQFARVSNIVVAYNRK